MTPKYSTPDEPLVELAKRLVARMERLSADSTYAHLASGSRGNLLKLLDKIEAGGYHQEDLQRLESLTRWGYQLLEQAAKDFARSDDPL